MPVASVIKEDILTVDRNGIGLQRGEFGAADITADAFSFELTLETSDPNVSDTFYFIILSDTVATPNRTVLVEVGPEVQVNATYIFWIQPESATYTVQPGDTVEDVRDGILAAINAATWTDSVSPMAVSTDKIRVLVDNDTALFETNIMSLLYKTGYYTQFQINGGPLKTYLIEQNSSSASPPPLGTLDSSYIYSDLTYAPLGIEILLKEPSYTQYDYSSTASGTTDISDSPQIGTVPPGKYVYHNSVLHFADYLNIGEYIKMIVI